MMIGLRKARRVYAALAAIEDERTLPQRLLEHLNVTVDVSERDLAHIPREGAAVMVVNHPTGILDGAVLAALLRRVRPDVKFLANGLLAELPAVRDLLIPVDPVEGADAHANSSGLRQALRFVSGGGLLAVFPAGEVAHFRWRQRGIVDSKWNAAVARLIAIVARREKRVSVVPAYVTGTNSMLFHAAGLLHRSLRTSLLVRELLNKRGATMEVRIGQAVAAGKLLDIPTHGERIEYLRWRTHLLAERNRFKPRTSRPLRNPRRPRLAEAIAEAAAAERMAEELAALAPERRLLSSREFDVYAAPAQEIPTVLAEIGRLREITFRAAGEGTGKAADLDRFDSRYLHLFVWNRERREVVGAYRLAGTDAVAHPDELYTATLFHYEREFLDRIGPALELGRSFVRAEYQRAFAPLLLLWKGIGRYVARNPRYKILFGPVSISNEYHPVSRRLMVSFLSRHAWMRELAALVSARRPFRAGAATAGCMDMDDLSVAMADLEPERNGVPVLLRQYLTLGGKLLAFSVDAQFADALDGLILVDLTRTERKLLERYLGAAEAAEFLKFHGGVHDEANDPQLDAARSRRGHSVTDAVFQVHCGR